MFVILFKMVFINFLVSLLLMLTLCPVTLLNLFK